MFKEWEGFCTTSPQPRGYHVKSCMPVSWLSGRKMQKRGRNAAVLETKWEVPGAELNLQVANCLSQFLRYIAFDPG